MSGERAGAPAPFTMLGGAGVVCEGDVCAVPGLDVVAADPAASVDAD